jgi:hypothetical protein
MPSLKRSLTLAGAALALTGCANAGASPSTLSSAPPSMAAESSVPSVAASPLQSPRTLTFEISPMGVETEAHGTVTVDVEGPGYTITVTVEGLAPNGHYPLNIHPGVCPNPQNTEAEWLSQDVQADEIGTLTFEKTYSRIWDIRDGGQVLTVHGQSPLDARTHIACADLTD